MRHTKRFLLLLTILSAVIGRISADILKSDSIPCTTQQDSAVIELPDTILDTISFRQFVVVNLESNVPVRDILVYTDDGQKTKTKWDGTFSLRKTFNRVDFAHPNYERRYILREEMDGDTIALIPNLYALNEVVVYGHRRNKDYNAKPSKVDAQLLQSSPTGFNLLGLVAWGLDEICFKKIRHREEMEKQKRKMIIENY